MSLSGGGICPVLWDTAVLHYDRGTCEMKGSTLQSQYAALRAQDLPPQQGNTGIEPLSGDVNADGVCNLADVVSLQKKLLKTGTLDAPEAGDLDGSGKLNAADLTLLKRRLLL